MYLNLYLRFFYCGLFFISGHFYSDAHACDRMIRLNMTYATAAADLIVQGRVASVVAPRVVSLEVTKYLKGKSDKKMLEVIGPYTERKHKFEPCQAEVVERGKEYVFFLKPSGAQYRVVDADDGVRGLAIVKDLENSIQNSGVNAEVKGPAKNFGIQLVSSKSSYKVDEDVHLLVVFRNEGDAVQKLNYRTWPRTAHTYCELNIPDVKAQPVPIARQDIEAYFSKHGQSYDIELKPHQIYTLQMERVNSAKPGWGYKETTGFQYYPLKQGSYDVSAICHGFFKEPIQTGTIRLQIVN